MNPNEQQTEDRIETVLTALRDTKPAHGMEQRITASLLRAHAAASPARQRWTWLRTPQIAGLAVVVAAALLVSARIHRQTAATAAHADLGHAAAEEAVGRAAEKAAGFSPRNPPVAYKGLQPRPALTGAEAPFQTHSFSGRKAASLPAKTVHLAPAAQPRKASQLAANAEQGFPAPPLPLTEQERLLLRLVHRDDPVQLAQLAPAAREAELQRDREQVREFFKPPPMLPANFTLEPYPVISGGTQ